MEIEIADVPSSGFKKMRLKLGLKTQSELAKRLGISVAAVSAWEKGTRHPSYEVCSQLLGMGASVEDLFRVAYLPLDVSTHAPYPNADDLRETLRIMEERIQKLESKP